MRGSLYMHNIQYKYAVKGLQLHYLANYSFYPLSLFMLFIGCFSGSPSLL